METNPSNPIPNQAPAAAGYQPDFAQRTHQSKALVAIVAVLGVTVMALAAALVVNKSEAQPNGSPNNVAAQTAVTPAPVAPTRATVCPAFTSKEISFNT